MKKNQGVKVLVMGSILQLLLGIIYVWSVFVTPVSKFFSIDGSDATKVTSDVKFTVNIMLCFFVIGILTGGRLQAKLKASVITLIGGMMMAAGMLTTALLPATAPVFSIYLTYGVIGGFGVGFAYNTIISCAQKWFPQKRGLATGISVFSFGFSSVIFAPLVDKMVSIESLGLSGTLLILAGVFAVATLALFSFITFPKPEDIQTVSSNTAGSTAQPIENLATGEMLKRGSFYLIFFSMMCLTAPFFIINPSLRLLPSLHGLSDTFGPTLVIIAGLSNSVGRLAVPLLGDKIGRRGAVLFILVLTAVGTACLCVTSGVFFIIAIAAIAFCYGGSSGIFPLVTGDYFGLKNIGSNYGVVMISFMLSVLVFPQIVGQLSTGDGITAEANISKFVVLAGIAVIGAVLTVILMLTGKKEKAK